MADDCCSKKGETLTELARKKDQRRVLVIVMVINLAMFFAEFGGGLVARSSALMADSVDMLGDAFVYALSLYALHRGARWEAGAAIAKGGIILVFGIAVIVEIADKAELFANPRHPYTQALLASVPVANPKMKRLKPMVDGDVPSPINPPAGCAFHTRCRFAVDRCRTERPGLAPSGQRHEVACWLNEGTGMPA